MNITPTLALNLWTDGNDGLAQWTWSGIIIGIGTENGRHCDVSKTFRNRRLFNAGDIA